VGLTESSCASHTSPGRVGRAHAVVYGKVPSTSLRSVAATPIVGDMAVRRRSAGGGWPWDDERTSRLQDMPTRAWACHPTPKGVSHHRHSERSGAKQGEAPRSRGIRSSASRSDPADVVAGRRRALGGEINVHP